MADEKKLVLDFKKLDKVTQTIIKADRKIIQHLSKI